MSISAEKYLKSHILDSGIKYITADEVVELAKDPDNPMHGYFEWDNQKAGHQYRLYQARKLIAGIKITYEDKPDTEVRLMVSVPSERGKNGYQLLSLAIKNPDARQELLAEIETWIAFWKERASLLDTDTLKWLDRYPARRASARKHKAGATRRGGLRHGLAGLG